MTDLTKIPTRKLLAMLKSARYESPFDEECYDGHDEELEKELDDRPTVEYLKLELAKRPHVPRGKKSRQLRAKQQQNYSFRSLAS